MGLLIDGSVARIEDLARFDAGLIEIARNEGVDLEQKIELARKEILHRLNQVMQDDSQSPYTAPLAPAMTAANVVSDDRLQRWLALETLALVYRDLYHSQLNDRYGKRWENYKELAENAYREYLRGGIPLVSRPIPRPVAPLVEVGTGILPVATYYLSVSLTRNNDEGEASEVTAVSAPEGHRLQITAPELKGNASGWNLYAGMAAGQLVRQSKTQEGPTGTYVMEEFASQAAGPVVGQRPEVILRPRRRLRRG